MSSAIVALNQGIKFMKIIQIHNWHRFGGGSELVVKTTTDMLKRKGHSIILKIFDSQQLAQGLEGKLRVFTCGIYSTIGRQTISTLIRKQKPDIIHIHEVYPFFSPWILKDCHKAGVPVVMTCHDYRLTCPVATHLRNGKVCELCTSGKEYRCLLKNCRKNIFESFAYASRSMVAKKFKLFQNNVTMFIALTDFAKHRLIEAGYPAEQIDIVPNMVPLPASTTDHSQVDYIAYIGRISSEKGIDTLLSAITRFPEYRLQLAGNGPLLSKLSEKSQKNISFLGLLNHTNLPDFYKKSKFIIVPSKWFEGCPIVILEAMSYGLPVIVSNIGGMSEIVDDGVTGFLFNPGNVDELAEKIKLLWENPELCRKMGKAGREKMIREYSEEAYYQRLIAVYEKAFKLQGKS